MFNNVKLCLLSSQGLGSIFIKPRSARQIGNTLPCYTSNGSSSLEVFCKKAEACNFIKKETLKQVFSCEFCESFNLKTPFFMERFW